MAKNRNWTLGENKPNLFVLRDVPSLGVLTDCGKEKDKNKPESCVYSCEFVANLKKQSQFYRSEFSVLSSADGNLKKQSQFMSSQIGIISYLKRTYGTKTGLLDEKNKANQTQFWGSGSLNIRDKDGNLLSQAQRRSWVKPYGNPGLEKR